MPQRSRQEAPLLLVGTDFRCAPLELRERVAYGSEDGEEVLVHLLARPEVAEAFLLSTCNRTEVYIHPLDPEIAYTTAVERVFAARDVSMTQPGRLYVKHNGDAGRHLLAVASGLESMVVGEPEILGQVKQAAQLATAVGSAGTVLGRLLRSAVAAGKRARRETEISTGAVSLGFAVVELARKIFTSFDRSRVLVLGAGETARMVVQSLADRGIEQIALANRTSERAERLKESFPFLQLLPFEERGEAAAKADLVAVATGAEEPVLTRDHIRGAMAKRSSRPLLLVDLGVPRNIDPDAKKIENVFLHTIDSLEHLIERNLRHRREEVPKVEELVAAELDRFLAWYQGLEAEPIIAGLQKQAESIRRQELAAALPHFPETHHQDLDHLTRALVRKILHHPSSTLRAGGDRAGRPHLELVRELFRLDRPLRDQDEEDDRDRESRDG